jgi:outer membrane protein OmpA-like peptidoglycan-associated protein
MMRWVHLFVFLIIALTTVSQEQVEVKIPSTKSRIYKQAMKAIELRDYFLAKRYFDALIEKGIESDQQKFEYAKLLHKLGENKEALKIINELIKDTYDHPLVFYYAAVLNNSDKNPKKARDYALFFLKKKGMMVEYKAEHTHLANLKMYLDSFGGRASDTVTSRVYPLEGPVNSSGAESSPVITNDGILFVSQDMKAVNYYKSTKLEKSKLIATRAVYSAKGQKEVFSEINNFPLETPDMEVSSFAYSLDKRVLYLSGCRYTEELKRYKCDIYQSKFKENTWTKPEIIPELTTPESSNTHVTIGFDATRNSPFMFFASDREGGRGGFDIYMSFYNTRLLTFSTPRNLGGKINTPKDDITPHYHTPSNTLYFSSNGRGGKGGHDVYYSALKSSIFEKVETLGEEINSPQDDVFFTPNKSVTEGYLVSNRYSENSLINPHCCDDIFFWEISKVDSRKKDSIQIPVLDADTKAPITDAEYKLFKKDSIGNSILVKEGNTKDGLTLNDLTGKDNYEIQLKSDAYLGADEKISVNYFKPNKSEILITKKGSMDKDSAKLLVLNNENKKLISDFDYEIFDVTNGTKERILQGNSKDPIELSKLKDNSKYEINIKSNGFGEGQSQFEIKDNKLSKNQFFLDPIKSLDIDSARIILKDKNTGEEVTDANYEIYDITDGKRERIYAKLSDLKRLKSDGKYEIKFLKDGYKNLTDTFEIKDKKMSKNTFYIGQDESLRPKSNQLKIKAIDKKTKEPIKDFNYDLYKVSEQDLAFVESGKGENEAIIRDLLPNTNYEVTVHSTKYFRKKTNLTYDGKEEIVIEVDLDPIDYNPILLPLVEFEFDSFTLTSEARHIIDSLVVPVLRTNPTLKIELSAHTDSRGTDEYNETLSQRRAEAIRFYLIDNKKIYPERLTSKGYGEYVPVAPNENADGTDNPEGRQRNRRCEFRILQEEYDPF